MRKFWAVGILATLAAATGVQSDDKKAELTPAKLAGTYQIVSGEEYGGKKPKEDVTKITVKISKDRITSYDKNNEEVYVQTYKLDTSKTPSVITMKAVKPKLGTEVPGLIEMTGDTVMLIYSLPGGEAPTEFKTKAKQLMFTMTKKK